jgi:acyl-CoA reductase-like NAD-dependent aldehyde dehydrogenase
MQVIETQVQEAVTAGATVLIGGQPVEGAAQRYMPTILTDVSSEMRICQEETFGPVLLVTPVKSEQEAIALTNESRFGLTASIWTRDHRRAARIARQLDVGNVSVNEHLMISGVPEMPWGGVKDSGYGRTKGRTGLLEMTYEKTFNIDKKRLPIEVFWYPYTRAKRGAIHRAMHLLYGPTLWDRLKAIF